jgi:hypothetical protein
MRRCDRFPAQLGNRLERLHNSERHNCLLISVQPAQPRLDTLQLSDVHDDMVTDRQAGHPAAEILHRDGASCCFCQTWLVIRLSGSPAGGGLEARSKSSLPGPARIPVRVFATSASRSARRSSLTTSARRKRSTDSTTDPRHAPHIGGPLGYAEISAAEAKLPAREGCNFLTAGLSSSQ